MLGYSDGVTRTILFQGSLHNEVNAYRKTQKLPPLKLSYELNGIAQAKCSDMANRNYYKHKSPDGKYVWEQFPFKYNEAGENLAYGTIDAESTVNAWIASKTHLENIINPNYTQVGYATCLSYENSYYSVQVLRSVK